jgi:hypothetical protein
LNPEERVVPYIGFCTIFVYVYTGASGDRHVYMGEMKGRRIYLENIIVPRSYDSRLKHDPTIYPRTDLL